MVVPSPNNFRGGHAPRPNDVFIAVMGVTGSGKSSFISLCSNKSVKIGRSLSACTTTVDVYPFHLSTHCTVYLIDTPGFDDTSKSDTEVLSEIAAWLSKSYRNNVLLHGIIYLHRITDIRMQGSAKKNLIMFKELCGKDALKRVILTTTMWDKASSDEAIAREAELRNTPEFWGWMLSKGSSYQRHDNTARSARRIINALASNAEPTTTSLQRELVDKQLTLDQTSAGHELQNEIAQNKARFAREIQHINAKMQTAIERDDRESQDGLLEELGRYKSMMEKMERNTEALRLNVEKLIAQSDERIALVEQKVKQLRPPRDHGLSQRTAQHVARPGGTIPVKAKRSPRAKRPATTANQQAHQQKIPPNMQRSRRAAQGRGPDYARGQPIFSTSAARDKKTHSVPEGRFRVRQAQTEPVSDNQPWMQREGGEVKHWWSKTDLGYFMAMNGGQYILRSPSGVTSNVEENLGTRNHPQLDIKLMEHGLGDLSVYILGPNESYYARWGSGTWSCWASDEILAALQDDFLKQKGHQILSVALGYGGSYVISYGSLDPPALKKVKYDLKGYYPKLQKFLSENQDVQIKSISLDPQSQTTFAIVFTKSFFTVSSWRSDSLLWFCSEAEAPAIISWMDKTWKTNKDNSFGRRRHFCQGEGRSWYGGSIAPGVILMGVSVLMLESPPRPPPVQVPRRST